MDPLNNTDEANGQCVRTTAWTSSEKHLSLCNAARKKNRGKNKKNKSRSCTTKSTDTNRVSTLQFTDEKGNVIEYDEDMDDDDKVGDAVKICYERANPVTKDRDGKYDDIPTRDDEVPQTPTTTGIVLLVIGSLVALVSTLGIIYAFFLASPQTPKRDQTYAIHDNGRYPAHVQHGGEGVVMDPSDDI